MIPRGYSESSHNVKPSESLVITSNLNSSSTLGSLAPVLLQSEALGSFQAPGGVFKFDPALSGVFNYVLAPSGVFKFVLAPSGVFEFVLAPNEVFKAGNWNKRVEFFF